MSNSMLKFVAIGPQMSEKRSAENRLADFDEIYGDYVQGAQPGRQAAVRNAVCRLRHWRPEEG